MGLECSRFFHVGFFSSQKRPLKLSYGGVTDNMWVSRRLTDEENGSLGAFIGESCAAKEKVVMSHIGEDRKLVCKNSISKP